MKEKIVSNIIFSFIEKFFLLSSQFIVSILLIRLLPREDYGVIGIVIGYFAFIHILNISLESIILRDHAKYDQNIEKYIYNFFIFNIFKSLLFIIIGCLLSLYLTSYFDEINFLYSIFSITIIYIVDSLVSPLIIYNSSKFNQKLVTNISFVRAFLNILILLGLFYFPTLEYIFYKDLFVSMVYLYIWIYMTLKVFNIKKISYIRDLDLSFLKNSFLGYSLWTHLNGVVTNFIYRSDTFFLSLFFGLSAIGNYNIALNSANVANIMPMIVGYQNSVALSHTKTKDEEFYISNIFIRISIYIGIITFLAFYFLGDLYLSIMTGESNNSEIYTYMIYIVSGLIIIKSFASPLIAYINIKGSVLNLFKRVIFPTFIISVIIYYISAKYYGFIGISQANVLISIFWLVLLFKEIKRYNYKFESLLRISDDIKFIKSYSWRKS